MGPSHLHHLDELAARRVGQPHAGPEILVLGAVGFDDGRTLIEAVRRGVTVLLDTRSLIGSYRQRLLDYCAGAVNAMDGQAHRAGEDTYLFAPALARIQAV